MSIESNGSSRIQAVCPISVSLREAAASESRFLVLGDLAGIDLNISISDVFYICVAFRLGGFQDKKFACCAGSVCRSETRTLSGQYLLHARIGTC
ncbi:MAG: hypothetical protein Q8O19_02425, partial [Rectinemataceae bacterium]|nr:hypothetical protein [Rectinemataceae bacterium]